VLEEWAAGSWLGILCGAEEDREIQGRRWFRDTLSCGGSSMHGPAHGAPEPGAVDLLYEHVRRFRHDRLPGGYTIPVPPGRYRVTVHLSSRRCKGGASPEVRVEGTPFDTCNDMELEFTFGSNYQVEMRIDDGLLNLEVLPGRPDIRLAAVEVERLH
jgi:hypothetical protein